MGDHLLKLFVCLLSVFGTHVNGARFFNVTLLQSAAAVSKGAVCLDGSPPGYAIDKGSGCGSNNWLVYIERLGSLMPASCTPKMNPGLCLFPENLVEDVQTPLFLLESSFDTYQIKDMLTPYIGGGRREWINCLNQSLTFCNSTQMEVMHEFQKTFIQTLHYLDYSLSRGMFVHTCYRHCHLLVKDQWKCSSAVDNILENKTIADTIGNWYFDRSYFQQIDSCNNRPRNCISTLDGNDAFNRKCIQLME